MLLKKDEASKANLLSILRKINDHLEDKQSRFLTGETMCCFDCELMPKLQHIRVAGEFFTDFLIPGKTQIFILQHVSYPLLPDSVQRLFIFQATSALCGGTSMRCTNWTLSHRAAQPTRTSSTTTNCSKAQRWQRGKSWSRRLSPTPFRQQSKKIVRLLDWISFRYDNNNVLVCVKSYLISKLLL